MVLVDSTIWVDADKQPNSPMAGELRVLLRDDLVATTDIVIAEVLQGSTSEAVYHENSFKLEGLHFFHATREIWLKAARLSFQLMRQGLTTPLSDLVIGTVALEADLHVYSRDQHFSRVPGLLLHVPFSGGEGASQG